MQVNQNYTYWIRVLVKNTATNSDIVSKFEKKRVNSCPELQNRLVPTSLQEVMFLLHPSNDNKERNNK